MNLLAKMEVFAAVAAQQSFTLASEKLSISKAYVSKLISELEKELGIKLLYRTTRKISLTEAGKLFYQRCLRVMSEASLAVTEMDAHTQEVVGQLTLSAPVSFTANILSAFIPRLTQKYHHLKFKIDTSHQFVDIIEGGFDLAIRSGYFTDSELIAKRLVDIPLLLCASAQYLKRRQAPKHPHDLVHHATCVNIINNKVDKTWVFKTAEKKLTTTLEPVVTVADSNVIKKLILSGEYIGVLPKYTVYQEIQAGSIIQLLPQYELPVFTLYALYPERGELMPNKLRIFMDELIGFLEEIGLNH